MSAKNYKTQNLNYDIAGGSTEFEAFPFTGDNALIMQIFHTGLATSDHVITLQHSLDEINYADAKDSTGAVIDVTINKGVATATLSAYGWTGRSIRAKLTVGTPGLGTITKIEYMMQ